MSTTTAPAVIAAGTVHIHAWDGGDGATYLEAKDTCGNWIAYNTFRDAVNCLDAVTTLREIYPDHTVSFGTQSR